MMHKLIAMWAVLRGRPCVYRAQFAGNGRVVLAENAVIVDCQYPLGGLCARMMVDKAGRPIRFKGMALYAMEGQTR